MKTIFIKEHEQNRNWFLIDAAGKPLGRVAAKAASILRGKTKATFAANQNMGDYVVISCNWRKRTEKDLLQSHWICWWS